MNERVLRVGLVSDTHLPHWGDQLPAPLAAGLAGVDVILHTGDFTGDEVPALFEAIAPLIAVAGNNDSSVLVGRFGRIRRVTLAGVSFGLVHGDDRSYPARLAARQVFAQDPPQVVCYGHSHVPECVLEDGTWYLNPGSPTDKRRMPDFSYALLELNEGTVTPRLVHFDDRPPKRASAR